MTRGVERFGIATLLAAPFGFGGIPPAVWMPLACLWTMLGFWALFTSRGEGGASPPPRHLSLTAFLLAIHALFVFQLIPLPPDVLKVASPGSYAAHYIPPPASLPWAPIAVSPATTGQAWLFFAGLHGFWVLVLRGPAPRRHLGFLFSGMAVVGAVLALQGLIQAASPQPHWLYGFFEVPGAGAHEAGIFGPYYNRDHFSNLIAIAASVAAALLAERLLLAFRTDSLLTSPHFTSVVALASALALMFAASAASGSRGGLVSIGTGVLVGLGALIRRHPRIGIAGMLLVVLVLFGTGVPFAVERLGDIDFEASRLMVWRDSTRLVGFFPAFGCGVGGFGACYWPYQRVVRFEYWPHAHNEFLQWVIETGAAGVVLAAYLLRLAWLAAPGALRSTALRPALAGAVAATVHALVDCGFRIPANAAWGATLVVCLLEVSRSEASLAARSGHAA